MSRSFVCGFVLAVALAGQAAAEVLPVPDALRQWQAPHEEFLALRAPDGTALGDQRSVVAVRGDLLTFDIATRFRSGEEWDEHGEMDLAGGFRSRSFRKVVRHAGRIAAEQRVDFTAGTISWLVDGVQAERTLTFADDTYVGPMMALVLAGAAAKPAPETSFHALVFRPDPLVVTLRAQPVERAAALGASAAASTTMRLKADLGPLKNLLLASRIPTHYFRFSHESPPELIGFEGALGNGLEVVMVPEVPTTTTALRHNGER